MKFSTLFVPALLATTVVVGCRSYCPENESGWCDPHANIPAGAIPQPAGTHSNAWYSAQSKLADQDDFVVYQYEWQINSDQLSPFGKRHVGNLTNRLIAEPALITIEPSDNVELDTKRREFLVTHLTERGFASARQRVVVACPTAEGLHGREAQRASGGYFGSGPGAGSSSGQNTIGGSAGGINSTSGGSGGSGGGFGF